MSKKSLINIIKNDSGLNRVQESLNVSNSKGETEVVVVTDYVSDSLKSLEEEHSDKMMVICCEPNSSTPAMLNLAINYASRDELSFDYPGCESCIKGKNYNKSLILECGLLFPEEIGYGFGRFFDNVYKIFSGEEKDEKQLNPLNDSQNTNKETIDSYEDYLVDNFLAIRSYGDIVTEYKKEKLEMAEETAYKWLLDVVSVCLDMGEEELLINYLPTIRESFLALFPEIETLTYAMSDTDTNNMFLLSALRGVLPSSKTLKSIICVPGSENCVGCSACMEICPVNAIDMTKNHKDSYVAEVSNDICIGCGKCQRVCPAIRRNDKKVAEKGIYALKPYDERHREESMSGGAFGCMAEKFVEDLKGVVYGVKLCDDMEVMYERAETINDIKPFKRSKYVQADITGILSRIEEDLKNEKKVLIGGTACHLHGLISCLEEKGIDTQNLFTVDLICHGVTVPVIYHRYRKYLEESYGSAVKSFIFRDKNFGWASIVETAKFENGKTIHSERYSEFLNHNLALNNPCFSCAFAGFLRSTDATIGDYWGVDRKRPEWYDNKGVSLVIKRTEKGEVLWNLIEGNFEYFQVERKECIQPNLEGPTIRPEAYRNFWRDYFKYPTRAAMKKYQPNIYCRASNGNALVLIKRQINSGYDWKDKFLNLGVKKVALYGDKDLNTIVATRAALSGIFITAIGVYPDDVTEFMKTIEDADRVIITDELFMPEILTEFKRAGFDLNNIIPVSYLVFEEASINE